MKRLWATLRPSYKNNQGGPPLKYIFGNNYQKNPLKEPQQNSLGYVIQQKKLNMCLKLDILMYAVLWPLLLQLNMYVQIEIYTYRSKISVLLMLAQGLPIRLPLISMNAVDALPAA